MNKQIYNLISYIVSKLNFNVAVVEMGNNNYEYFLYTKYTPSNSGGSMTIDYVELVGLNVTQFITTNTIEISNQVVLNQHFQSYIESSTQLTIKFSKDAKYLLFSM